MPLLYLVCSGIRGNVRSDRRKQTHGQPARQLSRAAKTAGRTAHWLPCGPHYMRHCACMGGRCFCRIMTGVRW